jgi:recombinational DNA repair protein (RecF pathway)
MGIKDKCAGCGVEGIKIAPYYYDEKHFCKKCLREAEQKSWEDYNKCVINKLQSVISKILDD